MKLRDILPPWRKKTAKSVRKYDGAETSRHFSKWVLNSGSSDGELRTSLNTLVARCRDLDNNNGYAHGFFVDCRDRIAGRSGQRLLVKARNPDGQLNTEAVKRITDEWMEFSQNPTVMEDGTSMAELEQMSAMSCAREGAFMVRMIPGWQGNRWAFALQWFEIDHLDVEYNANLSNGNVIRLGIEQNVWGAPVAYHLLNMHPGHIRDPFQIAPTSRTSDRYVRIPAEEILHIFIRERGSQTRGIPWMSSAMTRMRHLSGYEEAEVIAARVAAGKMGFFESPEPKGFDGDGEAAEGHVILDGEPGSLTNVAPGFKMHSWAPEHPNSAMPDFISAMLKGVSASVNQGYSAFSHDSKEASYSAQRGEEVNSWERWATLQAWHASRLNTRVYRSWLNIQLNATGTLAPLPPREIKEFSRHTWQGPVRLHVDPEKAQRGNALALAVGATTYDQVSVQTSGRSFRENIAQIADEQKLAAELGVQLGVDDSGMLEGEKMVLADLIKQAQSAGE